MNGFLMDYIREFIGEAHKPLGDQNTKKAGKLTRGFPAHTQYLMKLGGMATQEGEGGLGWVNDIDVLALTAEAERRQMPKAVGSARCGLFFLAFLSSLAYLSLLRKPATHPRPISSSRLRHSDRC